MVSCAFFVDFSFFVLLDIPSLSITLDDVDCSEGVLGVVLLCFLLFSS